MKKSMNYSNTLLAYLMFISWHLKKFYEYQLGFWESQTQMYPWISRTLDFCLQLWEKKCGLYMDVYGNQTVTIALASFADICLGKVHNVLVSCCSCVSCVSVTFWLDLAAGFVPLIRRWNMRYKNPQLVLQHCFVASFCWCFPFFTLRDQLGPQQKHLLHVEEMQRTDWLICLVWT